MELVDESIKTLDFPGTNEGTSKCIAPKWKRSSSGWMEINTDGAICVLNSRAGAGLIARDANGCFISAEGRQYKHAS
jgi:hypothetical protein